MLVGVLISIMISIVVGVNLIPTIITSINTARASATAVTGFSGLGGLMEVLAYVYTSQTKGLKTESVPLQSNLYRIMSQIRGSLNTLVHGNLELSPAYAGKCVETRGFTSLGDDGIVRYS